MKGYMDLIKKIVLEIKQIQHNQKVLKEAMEGLISYIEENTIRKYPKKEKNTPVKDGDKKK